jgi:hypothetical protein
MSQPNEVGRLIAVAAKATLQPLSCNRLGKTRTWISDQRFWLIVIEFQPSGWEKGSYLNVGAMWLWHAHVGHSFNAGYRIANFVPFFNSEQFSLAAASLAAQAANEVQRLRNQFRSLQDIYRYLVEHTSEENPHIFHAAIAAGLAGEIDTARRLFQIYADIPHRDGPKWATELRERNLALAAQLEEPDLFRASVLAIIQECRALNRLPADLECLDG